MSRGFRRIERLFDSNTIPSAILKCFCSLLQYVHRLLQTIKILFYYSCLFFLSSPFYLRSVRRCNIDGNLPSGLYFLPSKYMQDEKIRYIASWRRLIERCMLILKVFLILSRRTSAKELHVPADRTVHCYNGELLLFLDWHSIIKISMKYLRRRERLSSVLYSRVQASLHAAISPAGCCSFSPWSSSQSLCSP